VIKFKKMIAIKEIRQTERQHERFADKNFLVTVNFNYFTYSWKTFIKSWIHAILWHYYDSQGIKRYSWSCRRDCCMTFRRHCCSTSGSTSWRQNIDSNVTEEEFSFVTLQDEGTVEGAGSRRCRNRRAVLHVLGATPLLAETCPTASNKVEVD